MSLDLSPASLELLKKIDRLPEKEKAEVMARYRRKTDDGRRVWYCRRGRSCDGKPHPGADYQHARGDQWPPMGDNWDYWVYMAGRGCIAPESLIDLADGRKVRVDELAAAGESIEVRTLYGSAWTDGAPFLKGFADLYRVTLRDGSSAIVTDQHRFLTAHGWRRLASLHVGDSIAAAPSERSHPCLRSRPLRTDDAESLVPLVASWGEIASIEFVRHGEFYDLTVPDGEHYSADGVWGHNSGKTASGSNWSRQVSRKVGRFAAIARTGPDFRNTIVEGESGLIVMCERAGESYDWKPALKRFTFENGSILQGFSGEEPDALRGPQFGAAWIDEASHIDLIEDVWSNLLYGLRLPGHPGGAKVLITTTPLPNKWTKKIVKDEGTVLVRVSTQANIQNLDESYRRRVIDPLMGTRQGRQELEGAILEDVDGALWSADMLRRRAFTRDDFVRILVGIDPAGSQGKRSDLTGIVVVGITGEGILAVLSDVSGRYSPDGWARAAQREYDHWSADAVVVERNFGGDMVKTVLESSGYKGRIIQARASAGKKVRAEPIVGLYEQERVFHLDGADLADLEDEQVTWIPGRGPSPNRVDALVWAATHLSGRERAVGSTGIARGTLRREPQNHAPGSRYARKNWNRR